MAGYEDGGLPASQQVTAGGDAYVAGRDMHVYFAPPAPPVVSAAPEVRHSLPPDTAGFSGRIEELDAITAAVAGSDSAGGAMGVRTIAGMPGAGKTALAVRAAYMLREKFPDRQLFVNLHAHTPGRQPVSPEDALAGLLTATGVDPRYLPGDLDGRAAMWRHKMAGQRALLVADNAASSGQVAPLLPAGDGCLVLVTSRRHLGDLPVAVAVQLGTLPPQQAQEMFTRLAPRATGNPGAVAEVTRLAGFLPLAISLLARVFARHPSWTLADLAAEIRENPLDFKAENDSVAAAFAVSYRHLDPARQLLFRLLGLHPGVTIDACAAAALASTSLGEAARLLDALYGEGLLTETSRRRYGMHDLLRRYARDLVTADPADARQRALDRLLDYYQHTAACAEARLARQTRPGPAPGLSRPLGAPALEDSGQALAWARADRANLLACLDHAAGTRQDTRVVALSGALAALFRRDGPWADAIARHTAAIEAARRLGDRLGQANALSDLGDMRRLTGDHPGAVRAFEQALGIYRDLGDRLGQANAISHLGTIQSLTDDYPGAAQNLQQGLGIYRDLGDRIGEANALAYLAEVQRRYGDYIAATRLLAQALSVYRDLGNRSGEANALNCLGPVYRLIGDYPGAAQALERALDIYRDLRYAHGEANTLNDLGLLRRDTGDYAGAAQALEQALTISRDLGDRLSEANALTYLGSVRRQTGDHPGAAQALEQALAIFRDLGDRLGEANALTFLGSVLRQMGDCPGAVQALEQALAIYGDLGDRGGEAEALNETGAVHRISGELTRAEERHQQALELSRAIGSSWDEAHALAGLGRCALAAGQAGQARGLLQQAHEIFQRIGAAEALAVLAELTALAISPPQNRPCSQEPLLRLSVTSPRPRASAGPGPETVIAAAQTSSRNRPSTPCAKLPAKTRMAVGWRFAAGAGAGAPYGCEGTR